MERGRAEAEELVENGWRQGSVFRPFTHPDLPAAQDGSYWIVLSQSCDVVSVDWSGVPRVEIAEAVPNRGGYGSNDPTAKGKSFKKLALPIAGEDFGWLDVKASTRHFVPREILLGRRPDELPATGDVGLALGSWLSRMYLRAALPNELVARFKACGLQQELGKALKTPVRGGRLHGIVRAIYVAWAPDDELGPYRMMFRFVHKEAPEAASLETLVRQSFGGYGPDEDIDLGVGIIAKYRLDSEEVATVHEFDGMVRLSEWDYLTELGEDTEGV